jgi:hypothetical protein
MHQGNARYSAHAEVVDLEAERLAGRRSSGSAWRWAAFSATRLPSIAAGLRAAAISKPVTPRARRALSGFVATMGVRNRVPGAATGILACGVQRSPVPMHLIAAEEQLRQ